MFCFSSLSMRRNKNNRRYQPKSDEKPTRGYYIKPDKIGHQGIRSLPFLPVEASVHYPTSNMIRAVSSNSFIAISGAGYRVSNVRYTYIRMFVKFYISMTHPGGFDWHCGGRGLSTDWSRLHHQRRNGRRPSCSNGRTGKIRLRLLHVSLYTNYFYSISG